MERYTFTYPGKKPILLIFLRVAQFAGEPANRVFDAIRWEHAGRLADYDFLEGDTDFVRRLSAISPGTQPGARD